MSVELQVLDIPDEDQLFLRVHRSYLDIGVADPLERIQPRAFDQKGDDGLSVDWSRYSTPEQSLSRARNPSENGILAFLVHQVRAIPLAVQHDPITENFAHSLIIGIPPRKPSDAGVRMRLRKIAFWALELKHTEDK